MDNKLMLKLAGIFACMMFLMAASQTAALILISLWLLVFGVFGLKYTGLFFRAIEADIRQKEASACFQAVSSPHGVLSLYEGRLQFWTRESSQVPVFESFDKGEGSSYMPLLPFLSSVDRALIVAGMGSGKTELLKWIAKDAVDNRGGDIFIIDSHASPYTWPIEGVNVVGIGRDYPQIEATLKFICSVMDKRYKDRAKGVARIFHPITVIIDEMTVLNMFTDLKAEIKSLLCECRKVNIRLFVAGQSDRAGALGLSGNNDLRAGFEAIVYLKKKDGLYLGDVYQGTAKEPETFLHPGVFPSSVSENRFYRPDHSRSDMSFDGSGQSDMSDDLIKIAYVPDQEEYAQYEPMRYYESAIEKKIVEDFGAGVPISRLAKTYFKYSNGQTIKKVKAILEKHSLS